MPRGCNTQILVSPLASLSNDHLKEKSATTSDPATNELEQDEFHFCRQFTPYQIRVITKGYGVMKGHKL